MPCDSIITNSVSMPAMQPELLKGTLEQMGATDIYVGARGLVTFTYDGARCTLDGGRLSVSRSAYGRNRGKLTDGQIADAVKRGYSHQVVKVKAKQNGWKLQQVGANRYKVTR